MENQRYRVTTRGSCGAKERTRPLTAVEAIVHVRLATDVGMVVVRVEVVA